MNTWIISFVLLVFAISTAVSGRFKRNQLEEEYNTLLEEREECNRRNEVDFDLCLANLRRKKHNDEIDNLIRNGVDVPTPLRSKRERSDECGGFLDADEGHISYRADELLTFQERCVWVLIAPHTKTEFDLEFISNGVKQVQGEAEVLIDTYWNNKLTTQGRNNDLNGLKAIYVIVTLYNTAVSTKGFSLRFHRRRFEQGGEFTSDRSCNYQIRSPLEAIHYPTLFGSYSRFEITSFVFYNTKDAKKDQKIKVDVSRPYSKKGDSSETVKGYTFSNYRWVINNEGMGRSDKAAYEWIIHDDIVFISVLTNYAEWRQLYVTSAFI